MPNLQDRILGHADRRIKDPKVDSIINEYEEIPQIVVGASQMAIDMWKSLGKPGSPFTQNGEKFLKALIAMWEELYPQEAREWYASRKDYQNDELSINEQVHQRTGRSLASYPYVVYQMMRKFFPTIKLGDRKTCIKIVRRFPLFRMARSI